MRNNAGVTDAATARPRRIVLLGSTGSIGTQAIDIVRRNPDRFEVVGLSAGTNLAHVAEQAVALRVPVVAVAAGSTDELAAALAAAADASGVTGYDPERFVAVLTAA